MANDIGQILTGPPSPEDDPLVMDPQADNALMDHIRNFKVTPEVEKDPRWHAIGEELKKPENLMTAIVLAASMAQPRRKGQSVLGAGLERGVGTLAFRGELGRLNKEDNAKAQEAESIRQGRVAQAEAAKGQLGVAADRNVIEREQLGAQRAQYAATNQLQNSQIQSQIGMNTQDNETKLQIAQLQKDMSESLAALKGDAKDQDQLFGKDEMDVAQKIYDSSLDSNEPMSYNDAVNRVLRLKILTNPKYAPYLTLFEKEAAPASPSAVPSVGKGPPKPAVPAAPARKETAAQSRARKTKEQIEAGRKVGRALGGQMENLGSTQDRPKEKF